MVDTSTSQRLFRRYLKEQRLPVTHQREVIAQVVFSSAEHLSVEEIETSLRGAGDRIGKATITTQWRLEALAPHSLHDEKVI